MTGASNYAAISRKHGAPPRRTLAATHAGRLGLAVLFLMPLAKRGSRAARLVLHLT